MKSLWEKTMFVQKMFLPTKRINKILKIRCNFQGVGMSNYRHLPTLRKLRAQLLPNQILLSEVLKTFLFKKKILKQIFLAGQEQFQMVTGDMDNLP